MTLIDENMAEQATLDWFEELGYERVFGPDIAPGGLVVDYIGILTDEFLDDVKHMEHRNLAVELLERLLKDDIKARFATNVVLKQAEALTEAWRV